MYSTKGRIPLVLRYDDYSSLSNTAADVRVIAALKRHKMQATFAVIPYVCSGDAHDASAQTSVPLAGEKARILKEAVDSGVVDVALHGFSHQSIRSEHAAGYSEFRGLERDSQSRRILRGKSLLEETLGVRMATFIPPWGTYDSVTLSVLEDLGFEALSANMEGTTGEFSRLKFLPATCELAHLPKAIASVRSTRDPQPIVVAAIHSYDPELVRGCADEPSGTTFESILDWISSQPDVEVRSITETLHLTTDLLQDRYRAVRSLASLQRLVLPGSRYKLDFYPSQTTTRRMRRLTWFRSVLFAGPTLGRLAYRRLRSLASRAGSRTRQGVGDDDTTNE
jgi:peptidoglycan/xylan/chitin deacetylase (PgdA/CDA1 family)